MRKLALIVTRIAAASILLIFTLGAAAPTGNQGKVPPRFSPDRVLVAFHPGTPAADIRAAHNQAAGRVIKTIDGIGVEVVAVPANTVLEKVALYRNNPNVRFAEPNYYRILILPNEGEESDPPNGIGDYWKEQWGLHNIGQSFSYSQDPLTGELTIPAVAGHADADIDAPEGWDSFFLDCPDDTTCPPGKVAILDSGVDCTHPDLDCADDLNVVSEFIPEVPNGDNIGHGTHVAGIATALSNNNLGIAGIAWGAPLGSFKVCYGYPLDFPIFGLCDTAASVMAITYATDMGYDAINMSYGGPDFSQAESDAIDYARNNGVVLVSSSGNDYMKDTCSYPAANADVIAVGATDWYDNLASYSNFGDCVSVLAPGSEIFSTYPDYGGNCGVEGCYTWFSGTSMASPHVAGIAALLKTILGDSATSSEIRNIIEITADETGTRGQNFLAWSQHGRLNLASAMTDATGTPPPPPPDTTNAMYVSEIKIATKGPNLNATVTIRRDSNGTNAAESDDAPVVGAILSVELCPTSNSTNCNFRSTASVTNNKGQVNYKALSSSGSYRFEVLGIAHDTYDYDTSTNLDVGNPAFYP